jgi:hypothetical protein
MSGQAMDEPLLEISHGVLRVIIGRETRVDVGFGQATSHLKQPDFMATVQKKLGHFKPPVEICF